MKIVITDKETHKRIMQSCSLQPAEHEYLTGFTFVSTRKHTPVIYINGFPTGEVWLIEKLETFQIDEEISPEGVLKAL